MGKPQTIRAMCVYSVLLIGIETSAILSGNQRLFAPENIEWWSWLGLLTTWFAVHWYRAIRAYCAVNPPAATPDGTAESR